MNCTSDSHIKTAFFFQKILLGCRSAYDSNNFSKHPCMRMCGSLVIFQYIFCYTVLLQCDSYYLLQTRKENWRGEMDNSKTTMKTHFKLCITHTWEREGEKDT